MRRRMQGRLGAGVTTAILLLTVLLVTGPLPADAFLDWFTAKVLDGVKGVFDIKINGEEMAKTVTEGFKAVGQDAVRTGGEVAQNGINTAGHVAELGIDAARESAALAVTTTGHVAELGITAAHDAAGNLIDTTGHVAHHGIDATARVTRDFISTGGALGHDAIGKSHEIAGRSIDGGWVRKCKCTSRAVVCFGCGLFGCILFACVFG